MIELTKEKIVELLREGQALVNAYSGDVDLLRNAAIFGQEAIPQSESGLAALGAVMNIRNALEIFTDTTKQLEYTKGGYFIYRLTNEDMVAIAKALYPGRWIVNQGNVVQWIEKQKEEDHG